MLEFTLYPQIFASPEEEGYSLLFFNGKKINITKSEKKKFASIRSARLTQLAWT